MTTATLDQSMPSQSATHVGETMQAIVQHKYGAPETVLELQRVERPVVGDGDVLISVRAASVNPADWHIVRAKSADRAPVWLRTRNAEKPCARHRCGRRGRGDGPERGGASAW